MMQPVGITARHFTLDPATRAVIEQRVARLERFHHKLQRCDVVIEGPSRHHQRGGEYTVHIDLRVPGAELAVTRGTGDDLDVVIHRSFDAARRRLQDQLQRRRGYVKHHAKTEVGTAV